jgi:hypothetical protein
MDKWFDRAAEKFGYEAFLVPINNLDVLQEETVLAFLNSARDTLLTRHHVWWILVAGPSFFLSLETKARRVSELVTGLPISLDPLSLSEVHDAIQIRSQHFGTGNDVELPVPEDAVDLLYDVSDGEIRYIFKRLSDVVYSFRLAFPSEKHIPIKVAKEFLQLLARQKMEGMNLTMRELDLLRRLSGKRHIRIRDYNEFGFPRPQRFEKPIKKLTSLGLLRRVEKTRREVWYSTTGDANLAFS